SFLVGSPKSLMERLRIPGKPRLRHRGRVIEACETARLPAKYGRQRGSETVLPDLHGVAGRALIREYRLSGRRVAGGRCLSVAKRAAKERKRRQGGPHSKHSGTRNRGGFDDVWPRV